MFAKPKALYKKVVDVKIKKLSHPLKGEAYHIVLECEDWSEYTAVNFHTAIPDALQHAEQSQKAATILNKGMEVNVAILEDINDGTYTEV